MKVVHLSNTPLSNAPDNLVRSLNHYGHEATLYLHRKTNINKVHVGGDLWRETPYETLEKKFKETDVIHFHNYCWSLEMFTHYPELLRIARTKPCLIQYHSPRDSIESFEESVADKSLKHAVIAQYHVRQYPECEYIVPNVIPLFDNRYQPLPAKWDAHLPTVSFAPSNITLRGWDNKGYDVVDPILRSLEQRRKIHREVMIGVPYEECMVRKRWSHIGIDEIMTGSYHLSALEYMAMGCVTIVHMDDLTRQAMAAIVGEEGIKALPIHKATPATLKDILLFLTSPYGNWSYLKKRGQETSEWMQTYWHPQKHVERFVQIYQSL